MKPNRLCEKLNAGQPTVGTHLICPWPGLVEVIGHSGVFDSKVYLFRRTVVHYAPAAPEIQPLG